MPLGAAKKEIKQPDQKPIKEQTKCRQHHAIRHETNEMPEGSTENIMKYNEKIMKNLMKYNEKIMKYNEI